ncbi:GNAT family N-acetyltransferase [Candidatus Babeliales bacterium]|nr:GNAT family N-acetyltransferase [Candidatus Babeliales bacterium]
MNSKNVFFIIFVTIIIFSEQAAHAAAGSLLRLAIRSGCMKSTQHVRTYASSFDKLRTYGHAGFIDDYHPEDEAYIAPIAIKHMFKLTNSSVYQDDAHKAWEQEIAVALSSPAITSKVYRNHDGIPVAFINYEVQEPSSFAKWLPEKLSGSTGHIRHMAVADEHQGCGIGGELLEEAMRVCEEHGVCCIELGTTGYPSKDLVKFYRNAGFRVVKEPGKYSTCSDTKWQKKIRPNLVGLVDDCVDGARLIIWMCTTTAIILVSIKWLTGEKSSIDEKSHDAHVRVDCADDDYVAHDSQAD